MNDFKRDILKTLTNNPGVYYIKAHGHDYVGSARNLKKRLLEHLSKLIKGTHENQGLQNIYNKYKGNYFKFSILEIHDNYNKKYLLEREENWIKTLDPELNSILTPTNEFNCKTTSKIVYQFDLSGHKIKEYPSCSEAERQTGISGTSISACARGENLSSGGYLWSYDKDAKIKYDLERSKWKWRGVIMTNTKTNEILEFKNIASAARYIAEEGDIFNSICASISSVCNGKGKYVKKIYTFTYKTG